MQNNNITPVNLPALMGLRFVLSVWILINHLSFMMDDFFHLNELTLIFTNSGYYAVDLFFILSGIVITHHYGDSLKTFSGRVYGSFLWLRLARIYPLHLLTLLIVLCMVLMTHHMGYQLNTPANYTTPSFIENIFLVQAWHFPVQLSWNHFAWSISAEWLAYLCAPLFFVTLYRCQNTKILIILYATFLAVIPAFHSADLFIDKMASPVFRVLCAFGSGICVYKLKSLIRYSASLFYTSLSLFVLILVIEGALAGRQHFGFALYPAGIFLMGLIRTDHYTLRELLCRPLLQYGGEIAYAVYIIQFVILMPIKKILPHTTYIQSPWPVQIIYLASIISMVIGLAVITHNIIEQPARDYLRRHNPFRR